MSASYVNVSDHRNSLAKLQMVTHSGDKAMVSGYIRQTENVMSHITDVFTDYSEA